VLGVDVDPAKVTDFSRGITQLHEPKLAEMLARHAASGMSAATTGRGSAIQATAKEVIACDKADGFAEVRRSVPPSAFPPFSLHQNCGCAGQN